MNRVGYYHITSAVMPLSFGMLLRFLMPAQCSHINKSAADMGWRMFGFKSIESVDFVVYSMDMPLVGADTILKVVLLAGHLQMIVIWGNVMVLLELITGRKVIDTARPNDEQNLVNWANPRFRDPKQFPEMVDPQLEGKFPEKDLNQAVAIAAMCLQYEASARPLVSDIVTA
ncbi:hypothetical protein MLD38_016832 [Melastoma candidum]|uniref:Uncharacterized protein n=1 Tax=Melastoma candidum TaxID=119954 RepID=A0ACB9QRS8_9MYRT|nr:hypothetical protein MLD38_016832 [Melastoma candidum]